jgi:hypothetical protein
LYGISSHRWLLDLRDNLCPTAGASALFVAIYSKEIFVAHDLASLQQLAAMLEALAIHPQNPVT